jgi:hypothetical protein
MFGQEQGSGRSSQKTTTVDFHSAMNLTQPRRNISRKGAKLGRKAAKESKYPIGAFTSDLCAFA